MHRVIRVSKTAPLFSVLWYLKGCIDLRRVLLKGVSEVRAERALDVGHRVGGQQGPTTCRREGREDDTEPWSRCASWRALPAPCLSALALEQRLEPLALHGVSVGQVSGALWSSHNRAGRALWCCSFCEQGGEAHELCTRTVASNCCKRMLGTPWKGWVLLCSVV